MTPINTALRHIKTMGIPMDMLKLGFNIYDNGGFKSYGNIDSMIIDTVIKGIVLKDTMLFDGLEVTIPVSNGTILHNNGKNFVIKFPPALLGNRKIINAHHIMSRLNNPDYNDYNSGGSLTPIGSAESMMDSFGGAGIYSTSQVEVLNANTLFVHEPYHRYSMGAVTFEVEKNTNLSQLNPRHHLIFAEICMLACKAYIHNALVIKINNAYIKQGHTLNKVNEHVEMYADAYDMYKQLLTAKWNAILFTNNKVKYSNHLNSLFA